MKKWIIGIIGFIAVALLTTVFAIALFKSDNKETVVSSTVVTHGDITTDISIPDVSTEEVYEETSVEYVPPYDMNRDFVIEAEPQYAEDNYNIYTDYGIHDAEIVGQYFYDMLGMVPNISVLPMYDPNMNDMGVDDYEQIILDNYGLTDYYYTATVGDHQYYAVYINDTVDYCLVY